MKILVTGANGQLGMCLRRLLTAEGNTPSVAKKKVDAPSGVLPSSVFFTDVTPGAEYLDITDLSAIRAMVAKEGIDTIVNCAAFTNVDAAEDQPELAELLNAKAVENLAVAMKEVGGLLVHISTDYVFGGDVFNTPAPEDRKGAPTGVYGLTKLHGEQAIQATGVRAVVLRTAWLYSEFGKNFVKTMLRLTAEKPSLKVVFDQVGTPTYAGDLADAIVRILQSVAEADTPKGASTFLSATEGVSASGVTVYNYTNEGVCSWFDFAKAIAAYAGHTACDIQPCHSSEFPSKVQRPAYSVLDKSKIKATFGLQIPYWTDSLKRCLQRLQLQ